MADLLKVKSLIEQALPGSHVLVNDLTGGGDHLAVVVSASQFAGKGLIDQHQMIYSALKHLMAPVSEEIHALQIKTLVPDRQEPQRLPQR